MTQGKSYVEDVARVVRESAYVFPLLWICNKLKYSNPDCRCLTWPKYSFILTSLASNSPPPPWPTTNLESKNISIAFSPIFCTMAIPTNRASYLVSLFVAEKFSLNDFSIVIFSEDTRTNPTLDPFWFIAPSTYTLQDKGSYREIMPTDFPSMPRFSASATNRDSTNSTTRFARTWPLTEVRGMYLMSKAPRIVPHLAIIPM